MPDIFAALGSGPAMCLCLMAAAELQSVVWGAGLGQPRRRRWG